MKYVVFGLGISGKGACKLLDAKDLEYIVVDDKQGISSEEAKSLTNQDDVVIKSPGISWTNEYLKFCKEKGIKIISEIDLGFKFVNPKTKLICITGTNGKTTTVTETAKMLQFAGYSVGLGGNEGHSFSDLIVQNNEREYIVLELSSYQLENNPTIKPYIALVTNLTPDHLLRYASVEDYYKTKLNIFKNQDENDYAIINHDDEEFDKIFEGCKSKIVYIKNHEDGIYFKDELIITREEASLKGEHNVQNMMNIVAIGKILGLKSSIIKEFLETAKPLEHRTEVFFKKGEVTFINDSKGTNVESSLVALDTYKGKDIILICGGQDKKIDNTRFYQAIYHTNAYCLLIGENANQYVDEFKKTLYDRYINVHTLENAVEYLKENLDFTKEQYVILSPATASFDQFKSFEQRGQRFKALVIGGFKNV